MEDLVASAFIGLLEKGDISDRKISMRQLVEYKKNVVKTFREKEKVAIIPISRNYTARFLYLFGDFFSYEGNIKTGDYICLARGITLRDLQNEFCTYISVDVRSCFADEKNLAPILSGVS
jgi:hypothetical protein